MSLFAGLFRIGDTGRGDVIYGSSCYDQNTQGETCDDSQTGGDPTPEPVPEPGTLTLVLGGALLAARHYKKSHS